MGGVEPIVVVPAPNRAAVVTGPKPPRQTGSQLGLAPVAGSEAGRRSTLVEYSLCSICRPAPVAISSLETGAS
ncbi:hypothetical protein V501_03794 [Pseudogymnoascus sp. VKM F-4519 (FW-2642)]|nr:hypothetical protein V501_03794 [Pseudogymnoascus sp. VKM F-4519 (FW-2642)]